ncbi:FAD-binding protein [Micromonospora rifamycinica]|uniref:FAD-binding oxidoreductase n=1 Tax=Micromonospora rifamycinica TaxID=291594 RepID=UPI003427DA41
MSRRFVLKAAATGVASVALGGVMSPLVWAASTSTVPWSVLRACLDGDLVLPADPGYDQAKQLAGAQYDGISPQAVAFCTSADDVRTCVLFAQDNDLPVALRSGGHSPGGFSTGTGLVVDVSRMNSVSVGTGTVTIGAGVQQVDALAALAPQGLALAGGLCPTVGAAGFIQGGGFGWLTRRYGMACDHLVSAQVVLANGCVVTCSEQEESDLFWAIRGGCGGNFGVVTSFEVTPIQITRLVNFTLTWPGANAGDVLAAWQDWMIDGPVELGSGISIQTADAAPGFVPQVIMFGAWQGTTASLDVLLDALVTAVGAAPSTRTVQDLTYRDAMMQRYNCSDKTVEQCHRVGTSPAAVLPRFNYLAERGRMFSAAIPATGISAIMAAYAADPVAGHSRAIHVAGFGGEANAVARTATAYVHRDAEFTLSFSDGLPTSTPSASDQAVTLDWVGNGFTALDPYSNGETYQNFTDKYLDSWRSAYYAENYPRLVTVKQSYDPHRFFTYAQAVG